MTPKQVLEFIAAVDECRRLQTITPWPCHVPQLRAVEAAEKRVDDLLEIYREVDPAHLVAVPGPAPTSSSTS